MNPKGAAPAPRENPFSTCYTRPGALVFLFSTTRRPGEMTKADAPDAALHRLVERFQQQGGRGQIIGPHGSGKSTLLAALVSRLASGDKQVVHLELHDGQRRLPKGALARVGTGPAVIVVDGYEQLAWWSRLVLHATCRRRRWGLLVTAHADVGLPTLYCTASSAELASEIVTHLLHGDTSRISLQDVQAAYTAASGDMRETLFALYDLYEARQPR